MKEKPVEAMRKKPDASVFRCWKLMAEQKVDGLVSPGNTGAVVAGGLRTKKFLKCVQRPGIATVMPTVRCTSMRTVMPATLRRTAARRMFTATGFAGARCWSA